MHVVSAVVTSRYGGHGLGKHLPHVVVSGAFSPRSILEMLIAAASNKISTAG